MEIQLKDFRAFHETQFVDIKPVNILVGENSSGKSSFMAACKFMFDSFSRSSNASFNADPFYLGSFRDVSHFRGGKAGRAKEFSFEVAIDRFDLGSRKFKKIDQADLILAQKPDSVDRRMRLKISFSEYKSQSMLSEIRIGLNEIDLKINIDGKKVVFSDNSGTEIVVDNPFFGISTVFRGFELSYLPYLIRDFRLFKHRGPRGERKKEDISAKEDPERKALEENIEKISEYFDDLVAQVSLPTVASAPVRTEPQRSYQMSDRELYKGANQAAFELAQMSAFEASEWFQTKQELEEFGKNSGLFREINIRHLSKNKDGPFQIELKIGKQKSNIIDVGYGVSQVLPLVFDLIRAKQSSVFFFQQPEVHLHPKAQVELISLIIKIATIKQHIVFVETHSDYIIDRTRTDIRDGEGLDHKTAQVIFFTRNDLDVSINPIGIDKDGHFIDMVSEYRKFFLKEKMRSLGVK
jgi:predicted ATPase